MRVKTKHLYEFGGFRIDTSDRLLWRGDEVIALPPKAFDLLLTLVENSGHVLSKDELMRQIWQDSFVEEANLSHHVFTLRKALGEDKNGNRYIETIPRRGYRFVASVTEVREEPAVFVAERTHSRIIIEEETEDSDTPGIEIVAPKPLPLNEPKLSLLTTASATSQTGWLTRHRTTAALLLVGLLVAATTGYFFGRNSFKSDKTVAVNNSRVNADSKIKITRLTNFGKAITNISPDGRFICYIQNYDTGTGMLWLRQVGSNKEIQLIEPRERIFYGTAFSPDGQFIYYAAIDRRETEGALYRVPVLGGPPTRLLGNFASMFTLSPDGRQVTIYRYSPDRKQRSLMIAALDSSGEQALLTVNYPEQGFSGSPGWSPDGRAIAFAGITEADKRGANGHISLFAIDTITREVKPLTTELWREVGKMAWSFDGQRLYFVASRPHIGNQLYYLDYPKGEVHQLTSGIQGYGNYGLGITADGSTLVADGWENSFQLWIVGADGKAGNAKRLTTGLDDGSSGIALLADGRIAYGSRTGDDLDLWTMKPDGTDVKALTADAFEERDVTATADGRYLVFASNRTNRSQLFRTDIDGSNLQQLTFGEQSTTNPDCSPDGKWVVYVSHTADKSTLWKIPIEGGTPIQLTDYHAIEPSFSPDGKLISCILPKSNKIEKGSLAIIPAEGGLPIKSFQVVQFAYYYVTPRWLPDGQAIVYTEKQNNVGNLWKQPLAGGEPQPLTNFKTDLISNFAYSRDGKNLVLARGPKGAYAVLIKDFQ